MTLIIFLLQTLKTTPVLNSVENGANKKSTGLVDYDSDSDEGTEDLKISKISFVFLENGSSDEDPMPPSKRLKTAT